MSLPDAPAAPAQIRTELEWLRESDAPSEGGRVLAYVYDAGIADLQSVAHGALARFSGVNALDPTVFPSVAAIENDLVGWGLSLLGGPAVPEAVGTVTSGGTESCTLAVKAARSQWRARHPDDPRRPALVLGTTGHPAFAKAAELLDVDLVRVGVDPMTMAVRADEVAAVLAELGTRACLVVASAPSYAHGVLDPVAEIAALGGAAGVPVHVDACIGGWVLPFMAQLGEDVPPFDLSVPGVRSLSVDLHKYAYAPKGSSLLLFSDQEYRLGTYFTFSDWPGYPVVNTTLQSTKSAGPMAAAWAVARRIGADGYRQLVAQARSATLAIAAAVEGIPGLRVLATPGSTLLALGADPTDTGAASGAGIDPFVLVDRMRHLGWVIQAQPAFAGLPRSAHLTVQATTATMLDEFLQALRQAAAEARGLPAATVDPQLQAAAESVDVAALDLETIRNLTTFAGLNAGGQPWLPEEAAGVQALIEGLPAELRDAMLGGYFATIFEPRT
ncbi:MAG: aspartate aminotransferase family protein [Actinobacteria bacterium]|nr:MAG: aspartate aminotransferase family protein [Actinomycetota bacterium]